MRRALLAFLLAASPALAGTIPVSWQPSTDARVSFTRIHYAPGSVTAASPFVDVPASASSTVLSGLADCTVYHVAAKACVSASNCSTAFSTVLKGVPRVTIASVTYDNVGVTRITGTNFVGSAVRVLVDGVEKPTTTTTCTEITLAGQPGATVKVKATQADGTVISATYSRPLDPPAQFARDDADP